MKRNLQIGRGFGGVGFAAHEDFGRELVSGDSDTTDAITHRIELDPPHLSDGEVSDLIVFLQALTDPRALDLRKTMPQRVPSGPPLAEIREP